MLDGCGFLASASYASGTRPMVFVCGYLYGFTHEPGDQGRPITDIGERCAFLDGLASAGILMIAHECGEPPN